MEASIAGLPPNFGPHSRKAARAIMTSDTFPKEIAVECAIGGKAVRVGGIAKGAGMIDPNMATMLSFVTTDAVISKADLQKALRAAVAQSFNRITIDGDMSTNDTVLVLANGRAGNPPLSSASPDLPAFQAALDHVTAALARMIVKDGEGVTRFIDLNLTGARTDREARLAARAIANSMLVKCAWFGGDPNWGRIIDAIGYSGARIRPDRIRIAYDGVPAVENGMPAATPVPGSGRSQKRRSSPLPSISVSVPAHSASGPPTSPPNTSSSTWASRLDLICGSPASNPLLLNPNRSQQTNESCMTERTTSFERKMAQGSPVHRAEALIEALPYIQKFRSHTVVIKYGGSAMEDEHVIERLLRDIVFLEAVGINPVLVHGGGKAITDRMREAGQKAKFVNGLRVTDADAIKIVEEVLDQVINPRLVGRIGEFGGSAVGMSGTPFSSRNASLLKSIPRALRLISASPAKSSASISTKSASTSTPRKSPSFLPSPRMRTASRSTSMPISPLARSPVLRREEPSSFTSAMSPAYAVPGENESTIPLRQSRDDRDPHRGRSHRRRHGPQGQIRPRRHRKRRRQSPSHRRSRSPFPPHRDLHQRRHRHRDRRLAREPLIKMGVAHPINQRFPNSPPPDSHINSVKTMLMMMQVVRGK